MRWLPERPQLRKHRKGGTRYSGQDHKVEKENALSTLEEIEEMGTIRK